MTPSPKKVQIALCACGQVELEVTGDPVLRASCHCSDCHEGSRRIEALPNAGKVLDEYGGTPHHLYRKDRLRYRKGEELLKSLKVADDSPNRVYSTCCHSYLLLDLPGPFPVVPVSRSRFQGELLPLDMRINARFKPGDKIPADAPVYRSFPLQFVRKLLGAALAKMLHR